MCWFLPRGEARDGWRGQAIGLAQAVCLCVSWCCVCAGGMCSTLLLLRAPCFWHQLFRDDSWDFGLFVSCRPQFPPTGIHAVIFCPLLFLCILLLEKTFGSQGHSSDWWPEARSLLPVQELVSCVKTGVLATGPSRARARSKVGLTSAFTENGIS